MSYINVGNKTGRATLIIGLNNFYIFYSGYTIQKDACTIAGTGFFLNCKKLQNNLYNALALAGDAVVFFSIVSAFPKGLSLAKSIRIGAATNIDE